jgi:hypothetical protein
VAGKISDMVLEAAENLVNLPNLLFVLKVDGSVEVGDFPTGRLANDIVLTGVREIADL